MKEIISGNYGVLKEELKEASPRSGLLMKTEAVFTQCWTNINKMLLNCSTFPDYAVIFQAIRTGKNTFYY